jgi:hypothetical protein
MQPGFNTHPVPMAADHERGSGLPPIDGSSGPRRRFSPPVFRRNPPAGAGPSGVNVVQRARPEFGGGVGASAAAVQARSTGEIYLAMQGLVRGRLNALTFYFLSGNPPYLSGSPPQPTGNPPSWSSAQLQTIAGADTTFSPPSMFVRPDGEVDIAVQGPGNSLLYYHGSKAIPPVWSPAQQVAGNATTFSQPALCVDSSGVISIVAQGPGNSLVYYKGPHSGGVWPSQKIAVSGVNATTAAAPSIFVRPSGEVDIAVLDPSNKLMYYHALQVSGSTNLAWSSCQIDSVYFNVPAGERRAASAPSMFVASDGSVGVSALVFDKVVQEFLLCWYFLPAASASNPQPANWENLALPGTLGLPTTGPSVFIGPDGVVSVVAAAEAGMNWYTAQDSDGIGFETTNSSFTVPQDCVAASVCTDSGANIYIAAQAADDTVWLFTIPPGQGDPSGGLLSFSTHVGSA